MVFILLFFILMSPYIVLVIFLCWIGAAFLEVNSHVAASDTEEQ